MSFPKRKTDTPRLSFLNQFSQYIIFSLSYFYFLCQKRILPHTKSCIETNIYDKGSHSMAISGLELRKMIQLIWQVQFTTTDHFSASTQDSLLLWQNLKWVDAIKMSVIQVPIKNREYERKKFALRRPRNQQAQDFCL